jgi:CheY-like chemotaxis protein
MAREPVSNFDGLKTMHILFVEDNKAFSGTVLSSLNQIPSLKVTLAESRASATAAIAALQEGFFDLVILDLKIPTVDNGLDENQVFGQEIFYLVQKALPGTPIFILSASEPDAFSRRLSRHGEKIDVFGSGSPVPTVVHENKEDVDVLLKEVTALAHEIATTDGIELNRGGKELPLSDAQKRLLRIFTRRSGGRACFIELAGGLSDAIVLKVVVKDDVGAVRSVSIAKLGNSEKILLETQAYENHVKLLTAGAYAPEIFRIEKGVGRNSGVFYSLADEVENSLFDVAKDHAAQFPAVIVNLRGKMGRWNDASKALLLSVADVRRRLLSDDKLNALQTEHELAFINEVERLKLYVNFSCIHGDLHGANVLVSGNSAPVMIDFGDVGPGATCIDPVTLELSLLFHPNGPGRELVPLLEHWPKIDVYLEGSRLKPAVSACRGWAHDVGGGDKAVLAAAYAFTLRQLKYDTVSPEITLRFLRSIAEQLLQAD